MDEFRYFISILLIFFVFTDIAAAVLLFTKAVQSHYSLIALNERAGVAVLQAISASLLGVLGANRIFDWHLSEEVVLITISTALILQAIPSIMWLALYLGHKFDLIERDRE